MMVGNRLLDLFAGEDRGRRAAGRPGPGAARPATWNGRARSSTVAAARRPWAGGPDRGPRDRRARRRPVPAAVAGHRDRPAGPGGAAAGDHLRVQPGRLRRRRRPVRARRAAADHRGRGRRDPAHRATGAPPTLPQADLAVLGYWEWREALERGIAAHHAGLLPAFKETVEELFVRGLVRAVFATETLALGINMPARTVVLERLVKFNGEAHAELTPGEYTQLTGRAGRRGIDVEGHAVVVWQPGRGPGAGGRAGLDPHLSAAQLVPARLQHGGQPGRAAGHRRGPGAAGAVVRAVPGRPLGGRAGPAHRAQRRGAGRLRRRRWAATSATSPSTRRCGGRSREREKALSREGTAARRAAAADSLRALRPGDVIAVPGGRRAGLAVVLDPGLRAGGARSRGRWCSARTAGPGGCPPPTSRRRCEPLGRMRLPKRVDHRAPRVRRDLASGAAQHRHPGAGAAAPAAAAAAPRTTRSWPRCAGRCGRTRATAAPTGRRTPAGPSGTPGWSARPSSCGRRCAATTHSLARAFDRIRGAARPSAATSTGSGSPTARRSGWPGCGASPTCSPPSACGTGVWDGLEPGRAGRGGVRAGLRVAPGERAGAAGAGRRGVRGAGGDRADLGRAGGRRAPAPGRPHPRAGPGFRLAGAPLGPRRVAGGGADRGRAERQRAVGRRLRALVPAGGRPARPDRRRGRAASTGSVGRLPRR